MPKYLVQVGFTAEAWAEMSREPQSVVERVRPSAEALGGLIESLFYCFGDYDVVGVVDFPDNRGAAAWSMAVNSRGDVRAFKTTSLLTIEEGMHALGQASEAARAHRPPSAPS
ncbi:MAG: GYD domain-containing protein [Acidimicrobiales bacterium]